MSDGDLKGCDSCKGRKRLLGLGMMYIECPACKGIGWIIEDAPKSEVIPAEESVFDETLDQPKKPGRPKGYTKKGI